MHKHIDQIGQVISELLKENSKSSRVQKCIQKLTSLYSDLEKADLEKTSRK